MSFNVPVICDVGQFYNFILLQNCPTWMNDCKA